MKQIKSDGTRSEKWREETRAKTSGGSPGVERRPARLECSGRGGSEAPGEEGEGGRGQITRHLRGHGKELGFSLHAVQEEHDHLLKRTALAVVKNRF